MPLESFVVEGALDVHLAFFNMFVSCDLQQDFVSTIRRPPNYNVQNLSSFGDLDALTLLIGLDTTYIVWWVLLFPLICEWFILLTIMVMDISFPPLLSLQQSNE